MPSQTMPEVSAMPNNQPVWRTAQQCDEIFLPEIFLPLVLLTR
jgi:hypothetical protein